MNYRDLFPMPPEEGQIPNCSEAGVLGVLPGIIGTMQAAELIKLVTGVGEPLVNKLVTYNLLTLQLLTVELFPSVERDYTIPATVEEFKTMDYLLTCGATDGAEGLSATGHTGSMVGETSGSTAISHAGAVAGHTSSSSEPDHAGPMVVSGMASVEEIDAGIVRLLMNSGSPVLIDVRENGETPVLSGFEYVQIPLSVFPVFAEGIEGDTVILFCQHGSRSLKAAGMLKEVSGQDRKIYSLKGGVSGWTQAKR